MNTNDLVSTIPTEVPTLRELRRKKGWSLEAVELLSATNDDDGVDVSTSSRIERGLCEPSPADGREVGTRLWRVGPDDGRDRAAFG
jgi:hypothetical protein